MRFLAKSSALARTYLLYYYHARRSGYKSSYDTSNNHRVFAVHMFHKCLIELDPMNIDSQYLAYTQISSFNSCKELQ